MCNCEHLTVKQEAHKTNAFMIENDRGIKKDG